MKNRISFIREAISACGGKSNPTYYADGPGSGFNKNYKGSGFFGQGSGTTYKIESYTDGLTPLARECVAAYISKHPEVERAWVTKSNINKYYGCAVGGNLKVHFRLTADEQRRKDVDLTRKGS